MLPPHDRVYLLNIEESELEPVLMDDSFLEGSNSLLSKQPNNPQLSLSYTVKNHTHTLYKDRWYVRKNLLPFLCFGKQETPRAVTSLSLHLSHTHMLELHLTDELWFELPLMCLI